MYASLGANFSAPKLFRQGVKGDQKARWINGPAVCASFYVRTSAYTFENGTRASVTYLMRRRIGKFRVKGEVSMKGRNQHVTMRSDGNWQIKGEGACRASFVTTTQSEAIKLGRRICSNQESELIVHRRDGRIRARDSHGHDPFPPRG